MGPSRVLFLALPAKGCLRRMTQDDTLKHIKHEINNYSSTRRNENHGNKSSCAKSVSDESNACMLDQAKASMALNPCISGILPSRKIDSGENFGRVEEVIAHDIVFAAVIVPTSRKCTNRLLDEGYVGFSIHSRSSRVVPQKLLGNDIAKFER